MLKVIPYEFEVTPTAFRALSELKVVLSFLAVIQSQNQPETPTAFKTLSELTAVISFSTSKLQ